MTKRVILILCVLGAMQIAANCGGNCGKYMPYYRLEILTFHQAYLSIGTTFRYDIDVQGSGFYYSQAQEAPLLLALRDAIGASQLEAMDCMDPGWNTRSWEYLDSISITSTSDLVLPDTVVAAGTELIPFFIWNLEAYNEHFNRTTTDPRPTPTPVSWVAQQQIFMPQNMRFSVYVGPRPQQNHQFTVFIRQSDGRQWSETLAPIQWN
jgi:hypothetical protein